MSALCVRFYAVCTNAERFTLESFQLLDLSRENGEPILERPPNDSGNWH